MPAVALTDRNGLYAAVEFYQAARNAGIKPIIGVTLEANVGREDQKRSVELVLLAMDKAGYSNLCRLVTLRHLGTSELAENKNTGETEDRPVTLEELMKHGAGVMALCPLSFVSDHRHSPGSESQAAAEDPLTHFAALKNIFGDRLYIELHRLSAGAGRTLREAQRIGRELDIPRVATNCVYFLRREEYLHHRTMNAIRTGQLLTTVAPPEITTPEAWFKSEAEMDALFPDYPEFLQETIRIADRCNLELELGHIILPEFPIPKGENIDKYLCKICVAGAGRRYGARIEEALPRLFTELNVIKKKGLAPYFLLVWTIVEEAQRRGIPAVARGSAASSIVTYCLGISCVCPLKWELYFERFLNAERGDYPDIDIDICGARRDELLDYVYQRWGVEHVAMIGSFITMHARLAIREVAKVFGVPPEEVNNFTKRLPHTSVDKILQAIRTLPECADLPADDEPWKTVLQVALRLDGAPRHTGIHPCGTVISARPLSQLVPLERSSKGIVVTQYEMNAIESLGLLKMDLLGQRGFTTMALALDNIEKKTKTTKRSKTVAPDGVTPCPAARNLNFDAIPEDDPQTCEVIAAGRTLGVFQIESPALRGLLSAMNARTLDDLATALALIRPGAAEFGSKELFLKRLRKEEEVLYAHEALKPILHKTLGVCVFQEQVMEIATVAGNLSLREADIIRQSASKYSGKHDRERLRGKFLQAAAQMGYSDAQREEAWMMVEKFAGFGFCKAHSATYAHIAYRMAYLKTHHPVEFLAAMCSAGAGFYHVSAYVEEAKRWGVTVLLPSVNHSQMEYTSETNGPASSQLRIGLMQVGGMRTETITRLLQTREECGVFRSLEDFLRRVPVERDEIEALIKCGAFDDTGSVSRSEMLWRWNFLEDQVEHRQQDAASLQKISGVLFAEAATQDAIGVALAELEMPDYTTEQKLGYEREILEVFVSAHPLDFLPRQGETWSDELRSLPGKRVTLCGWMITSRRVGTKTYRNMLFLTLEDQRGVYEVVLFPDTYEKYGSLVVATHAFRVTGRVEIGGQINCERLEVLENE